MKNVFLIQDGFTKEVEIVATTLHKAITEAINIYLITEMTEGWVGETSKTIEEWGISLNEIETWDLDKLNDFFEGSLKFIKFEVIE